MNLPIQYQEILNSTQAMISDPASFDEQKFGQLIKPLEKDLLEPLDKIIDVCARKAIIEAQKDTHLYLSQCNQQMQKHQIASLGFAAGGAVSFGVWYKIAQLSSFALGTGIGCTSGFVWQEYLCNQIFSNIKMSNDLLRVLTYATNDVKTKMLAATKQRYEQLETQETVRQGKKKFDEHDGEIEDQKLFKSSSKKTTDKHGDEIKDLKRENGEKSRQLKDQDGKLKDLERENEEKGRQLKDQAGKLEDLERENGKKGRQLEDQAERLARLEGLLLVQAS